MHDAITALHVIFRMGRHPGGIGSGMVRYPVEPYLHIQVVCLTNKVFQVADGAIRRIRLLEIDSGIRTVDSTATGIDGHEPDNVDA